MSNTYNNTTTGVIVDTNDPQGRGRIRVYSPELGDVPGTLVENIPWCRYMSPFGGIVSSEKMGRGPNDKSTTKGSVAYGFWAIPKVGSIAVITCLNGDPNRRIYMGCLPPDNAEHTMPHGRFIEGDEGPLSSEEQPIQPLYDNIKKAFGEDRSKHEYKSRAIDPGITGLSQDYIDAKLTKSKKPDIRSGYKQSRMLPDNQYNDTDKNYENQIYAWTTPGFHSISMDDSKDNCRIRIRSSCGHQIIMDDTNERIYINTSEGNSWIELDQNGTIDIYSKKTFSISSDEDINFHAKKSIRLNANDIHINADNNLLLTSSNRLDVTSNNITVNAKNKLSISGKIWDTDIKETTNISSGKLSLNVTNSINVTSKKTNIEGESLNAKTSQTINIESPKTTINGTEQLKLLGPQITEPLAEEQSTDNAEVVDAVLDNTDNIDDMMSHMPSKEVGSALSQMDSSKLDNLLTKASGDSIGNMMSKIKTSDLKSALDKVSDENIGPILNKIPMDKIKEGIGSLSNIDLGNNLAKAGNSTSEVLDKIQNAMGDIFSNIPSKHVDSILKNIDPSKMDQTIKNINSDSIGSVLSNINSSTLGNVLQQITDTTLSDIVDKIPASNLGKTISNIPNSDAASIVNAMSLNNIGSLLPHLTTSKIESLKAMLPQFKNISTEG